MVKARKERRKGMGRELKKGRWRKGKRRTIKEKRGVERGKGKRSREKKKVGWEKEGRG